MKSSCLKYRKNTNSRVPNTSNGKTMFLSKCAICGVKNQDVLKIKKQKEY